MLRFQKSTHGTHNRCWVRFGSIHEFTSLTVLPCAIDSLRAELAATAAEANGGRHHPPMVHAVRTGGHLVRAGGRQRLLTRSQQQLPHPGYAVVLGWESVVGKVGVNIQHKLVAWGVRWYVAV